MKIFTHYFQTDNLIEKKALVLSDLHIFKEKDCQMLAKILEYVEKNSFDYIYIAGDVVDATNIFHSPITNPWLGKFYDFFKNLGKLAPTFVVYGSHDFGYISKYKKGGWTDDKSTFYEKFINKVNGYSGIHVLENETYDLGDGYTVSGYNPVDVKGYNPNREYNLTEEKKEKLLEDLSFLSHLDPNKFNTLLFHYPNLFLDLANDDILKNINLSIAGHNHNGVTQLRVFPLESLLNLIHQNNRGLITPEKSLSLKDTKYLRGAVTLNERNTLIINPSMKNFADCAGILKNLDPLFYQGASVIECQPKEQELVLTKK